MEIDVGGTQMRMHTLFTSEQIRTRVTELAQLINADYAAGEPLVVLVVLHGALLFAADLVRELSVPLEIESVRLKSYQGTQSTGTVELVGKLPYSLIGKNILVVEDIIDTGRSLKFLLGALDQSRCKSVRIATLLDKPESHEVEIEAKYVGFSIGPNFVIGYGLDLDGRYRNLPYIAELTKA